MEKNLYNVKGKKNKNYTNSMILIFRMLFVETGLNVKSGYEWLLFSS